MTPSKDGTVKSSSTVLEGMQSLITLTEIYCPLRHTIKEQTFT